jgi:hypothetical protein
VGHDVYITGRLFAYLLDLKEPKFVLGYGGPEMDIALMRGEIDARATTPETLTQRNADWIEKGLVDLHTIVEIPKGKKAAGFERLRELEDFAKSDREQKLLMMYRAFRLVGTPSISFLPARPSRKYRFFRKLCEKPIETLTSTKTSRSWPDSTPRR